MQKSISPEQARELLLSIAARTPETERVPVVSSPGRILAEDTYATIPIPPFKRSPFDGYAFRGEDTLNASPDNPVTLKITEEIPAGRVPTIDITEGFAAKILTGAPIPNGANATVKYEHTEFTAETVTFRAPVGANKNIVLKGEDVAEGELIARSGTTITPADAGLFASVGMTHVPVYRRPVAAIINTGTELVEAGQPLPFGKIYSSSVYTLIGALNRLGLDGYNAGVVHDDPDDIAALLEKTLPDCDVLITTGGASVGDYDFGVAAAEHLGAVPLFWKTLIQPGGAVVASDYNGKLVLALSGNPSSALMTLLYIASPFLKRLTGAEDIMPKPVMVRLRETFEKTGGEKLRIARGRLEIIDGEAFFSPQGGQGSSVLSSFAFSDMLAELPPCDEPLPAGTLVRAFSI